MPLCGPRDAQPPSTDPSLSAERKQILEAVEYDELELFGTRTACKAELPDAWVRATPETASSARYFCKVAKNSTGPRFEFFSAVHVSEEAPNEDGFAPQTHAGVSAADGLLEAQVGLQLAEGHAGAVDFKTGIGITTGVGLKDDSLHLKALGCGVNIGRKVGISFLDNEIAIDLGRLFAGAGASSAASPAAASAAAPAATAPNTSWFGRQESKGGKGDAWDLPDEAERERRRPALTKKKSSRWMEDDEGLGWDEFGDHPRAVQMGWLDRLMGRAITADRAQEAAPAAAVAPAAAAEEGDGATAAAAVAPAAGAAAAAAPRPMVSLDMLLSSQRWSSMGAALSPSNKSSAPQQPSSPARKRSVAVTPGPWGRRRESTLAGSEGSEGSSGGGVNGGARRAPVPMLTRLGSSLRDLVAPLSSSPRRGEEGGDGEELGGGGGGGGGSGAGGKARPVRKWTYTASSPKGQQAKGSSVHI